MPVLDLSGGCFCDAVRFRIAGAPLAVSHCHCRDCRRATGAPVMTWITLNSGDVTYTTGAPRIYARAEGVERGFCAACGTTLSYRHRDHPEEIDIAAAALDDPAVVTPQDHVWIGSKIPWLTINDGLPRLEQAHWQEGYPAKE